MDSIELMIQPNVNADLNILPNSVVLDDTEIYPQFTYSELETEEYCLPDHYQGRETLPRTNHLYNLPPRLSNGRVLIDKNYYLLANIDSLFQVTSHVGNYLVSRTVGPLNFCDLDGAPGSWSQYLMDRKVDAFGFNHTNHKFMDEHSIWRTDVLDMNHLNLMYNLDATMDLNHFVSWVLRKNQLDLVVCNKAKNNEQHQLRYLLDNAIAALKMLSYGGNLVLKLYTVESLMLQQVVYLICRCFSESYLFVPFLAPDGQYLIAKGKMEGIDQVIRFLEEIRGKKGLAQCFDPALTPEFNKFIKENNLAVGRVDYNENYNYYKLMKLLSL